MISEQTAGRGRLAGFRAAGFRPDVVAMLPVFERAAVLDVTEVVVPDEFADLGVPGDTDRGRAERRGNEIVIFVPAPAAMPRCCRELGGRGGGGANAASSMRACCHLGMRRGRFSGLAKKAKTSSGCVREPLLSLEDVTHGCKTPVRRPEDRSVAGGSVAGLALTRISAVRCGRFGAGCRRWCADRSRPKDKKRAPDVPGAS